MTIGQLANKTELTTQTIRYYESLKLIPKPGVTGSGYRTYTADYVDKLNFIKKAKELGFTLKEISSIFKLRNCKDAYELTSYKLKDTVNKLNYYKNLESRLKKLLKVCPASGSIENCSIIKSITKNK
jgi:DNA-binding transcriptional MerR regulator